MAERGGRRQRTWGAPVSWREAAALDAARAVCAARGGLQSRADWLVGMAEQVLRAAAADPSLPASVQRQAERGLADLAADREAVAANPPRPGRPPHL